MARRETQPHDDDASLICVGQVGSARGLKGEVRITSFTDDPKAIGHYGPLTDAAGSATYTLKVVGKHKGQMVARIEGVADRDAAEALNGTRLYIRRDKLPELDAGEFYLTDLVGLEARTQDGKPYGRVVLAEDYGAGAVLELELVEGKKVMVPFTEAIVPTVDMAAATLVICPPDGLLEPGEPEPQTGPDEGPET